MCRAYRKQYGLESVVVQPCNLYGPGDHYDLERSHVLPAMIRKFHEAKVKGAPVQLWGDGSALREFLHVDDLARACVMLMNHPNPPEIVNVGSGEEVSVADLSSLIRDVVGYRGYETWDSSKPNGTPRKLLDSSKIRGLGWVPTISLADGLRDTYAKLSAANFAW
jgi:GDP-L-fucose synthase